MKKSVLSLVSILVLSELSYAGGDIGKDISVADTPIVAVSVVDDSAYYVGAGYSILNYDEVYSDGVSADVDLQGLTLILGYQFNHYLSLEARYTKSLGGSDEKWSDGKTRDDVENEMTNLALYLKPSYPVGDFKLYGLLGYGQLTYQYQDTEKQTENGFQWGLGTSYSINNNLSVFVDYTQLYDDTGFDNYIADCDYEADAWTVGITYSF